MKTGLSWSFTVIGTSLALSSDSKGHNLSFKFWLDVLSVATILRDRVTVEWLCKVPPFNIKQIRPFEVAIMTLIFGLFNSEIDLKQAVLAVMDASAPEKISPSFQDYAYDVLMPLANVITTLITSDGRAKYADAMSAALSAHQAFWSSEDHASSACGWISLPLTAMA